MNPSVVFTVVCAFIFGINIGSFLNVVIWRLPRGGSIAQPTWSYCPKCEHRLFTADLVPVLSFLALGRKCRYCHAPISWRYPAIETLTAVLFAVVGWKFGWAIDTIFNCLFVAALVCVFFIDLEHFVIPDGLSVTMAIIGFAHNGVSIAMRQPKQFLTVFGHAVPSSIAGFVGYAALVYTVGLLSYVVMTAKRKNIFKAAWEYIADNVMDWVMIAVYYLSKAVPPLRRYVEEPEPLEGFTAEEIEADEDAGGMGSGDGKLAAAIGANLGLWLGLQSFLVAIFVGTFVGLAIMIRERRKLGGRTAIPFGPHMAIGAVVSLLFGQFLFNAWLAYVAFSRGAVTGPPPPGGSVPVSPTGS